MEVKITCRFEEQSQGVTAKAGVEITKSYENFELLDEDIQKIRKRSKALFEEAFSDSLRFSFRKSK